MRKTLESRIVQIIDARIEKIFAPDKPIAGDGYFSAEQLRGVTAQWKVVPFGNYYIPVKLKTLHAGEMPLVTLRERSDELRKNPSIENHAWLLNTLEDYCKKALLVPSYDEAVAVICKETGRTPEEEKIKLDIAFKQLEKMPDGPEKAAKKNELELLALRVGMFLPFNFMQAIAFWCECLDISQIQSISPDALIEAYIQSKKYGKEPAEYIGGVFTTQNRRELNAEAERLFKIKYPDKKKGSNGR
ncbi:MAG: hypothetical protein LBP76_09425 [Treponema sp.]|jgi:hypothetical protein|nr:hypothetical protein [Treponema sp.]